MKGTPSVARSLPFGKLSWLAAAPRLMSLEGYEVEGGSGRVFGVSGGNSVEARRLAQADADALALVCQEYLRARVAEYSAHGDDAAHVCWEALDPRGDEGLVGTAYRFSGGWPSPSGFVPWKEWSRRHKNWLARTRGGVL